MEFIARKKRVVGEKIGEENPICTTTMFARQKGPYGEATMLASTSLSSAWIYSGGLGPERARLRLPERRG